MKKRNEQYEPEQTPERRPPKQSAGKQESAADFALHLAAMFRAELGEEDESLDPVLNWNLPASEDDYREAAAKSGSDDELFRAVANFLDEAEEPPAPKQADAGEPEKQGASKPARERRSQKEAEERRARKEAEERRSRKEAEERRAKKEAEERRAKKEAEERRSRKAAEKEAARKANRPAQKGPEQKSPENGPEQPPAPEAAKEAAPTAEHASREQLVFFEPKEKKHSFFDSLNDAEPRGARTPTLPEEPAEAAEQSRESREDRRAAERREREAHDGSDSEGRTAGQSRPEEAEARGAKEPTRRVKAEQKSARGAGKAPNAATRKNRGGATRTMKRPTRPLASEEDAVPAVDENLEFVLRGFDATPFVPPQADPSLDEIFGPLGLKTAPPDPDPDAVLNPRVRETASGKEKPQDGQPEAGAAAEQTAPAPETEQTRESPAESASAEALPQEKPGRKRGWLRGLFRGRDRHAEQAAADPQSGPDAQAAAGEREETAAVAAETPGQETAEAPAQEAEAAVPAKPAEDAFAAAEDARILAAMEREIPGLTALLSEVLPSAAEAESAAPEASEPEPEPEPAVLAAPEATEPEAAEIAWPEAEPAEPAASEPEAFEREPEPAEPAAFQPEPEAEPAEPEASEPEPEPEPVAPEVPEPEAAEITWPELEPVAPEVPEPEPVAPEASEPEPVETTGPASGEAEEAWSDERLFSAIREILGDREEQSFGLQMPAFAGELPANEAAPAAANELQLSIDDYLAPGGETQPGADETPAAEERQSGNDETRTELHAPELWDPLSLFSEAAEEGPPPLTPLSRDSTGSLPTLEELFGPEAASAAAAARRPRPERPARRKKRGWLQSLLHGGEAQKERAGRPAASVERGGEASAQTEAQRPSRAAEPAETQPSDFAGRAASPDEELQAAFARVFSAVTEEAETPDLPEADAAPVEPAEEPRADEAPAAADGEAAARIEAEAAAPAEAVSPAEDAAEDWDPLALFGGSETDEGLPTWEEYLRASRGAAAPESPEAGTEAAPAAEEPLSEEAAAPLPETQASPAAAAEAAPPETDSGKAEDGQRPTPGDSEPAIEEDDVPLSLLFGSSAPRSRGFDAADGPAQAEPETVPMDLSPAPEPEPARRQGRRRGGQEALTLEDFLSAAVPMEELQPPKQEPPARSRGRNRRRGAASADPGTETISTARENPAGLILTWADRNRQDGQPEPAPRRTGVKAEPAGRSDEPVPSADVRPEEPSRPRRRVARQEERLPVEEKSVLHPEEAYRIYARPLDEIGSRLVLTGLFTLLSLFFTLYLSQRWSFLPEIFSGGTTVYVLLGLLALLVLVNRKLYFRDWRGEKGLRPELLLGLATLFTALDAFPAAQELRPPFTVVVGALLIITLWGRYDRGLALITTVKVLRAEQLSAGVSEVQDITKGSRGLIRTKPDVDRFMEKLETRDLTERLLPIYTPAAAAVGLLLTLLISLGLKKPVLRTGSLIFLGSVPVTALLAFPRLFCLLANRLSAARAALCGYHGAEVFGGEHAILIGDDDVFPPGSLTLNGFKVYHGNPDRIIAYAAAACRSSGSALDPVFEDLLVTHNGRHYNVDNFRFYDSGGIGASIMQDVVLLGSLDFMRRMGVHMDKGARVKQAVYMSLNGELAAVFAVRYTPPENLRKGLAAIAGNRHFKGILVTRTFLGTPGFLKAKFGVPTGAFHYPSTKERIRLSEAEMKRSGAQGAILAQDSFSGFAQAAAGGRMLRSATLGAAILTVLGGLIGMGLMAVLAALPAAESATAVNLLLYTAAWLVPTLLLTAWARHF